MELKNNHTIAELGLLLAVAVILGYVETVIPVSIGIPGVKLGLANCAVLFVMVRYGAKEAALVSILRTVIIAALFTNLSMLLYSLAGAICSIVVMTIVCKGPFSLYGVSIAGGVAHNIAQLFVAFAVLGASHAGVWWVTNYLPILLVCGLSAGCINALIAGNVLKKVPSRKVTV